MVKVRHENPKKIGVLFDSLSIELDQCRRLFAFVLERRSSDRFRPNDRAIPVYRGVEAMRRTRRNGIEQIIRRRKRLPSLGNLNTIRFVLSCVQFRYGFHGVLELYQYPNTCS